MGKSDSNLVSIMAIGDLSTLLDNKLQNLATKADVEEVRIDIRALKSENDSLKHHLSDLQTKVVFLEKQLEHIQMQACEKNLMVKVEAKDEQQTAQVVEICTKLSNDLNSQCIDEIKEIKSWNSKFKNFIVKLHSKENVSKILRNTKKIKNTNISIQKDYPHSIRRRRAHLLHVRKIIKRNQPNLKAVVKDDKLVVESMEFTWVEAEGLQWK